MDSDLCRGMYHMAAIIAHNAACIGISARGSNLSLCMDGIDGSLDGKLLACSFVFIAGACNSIDGSTDNATRDGGRWTAEVGTSDVEVADKTLHGAKETDTAIDFADEHSFDGVWLPLFPSFLIGVDS